MFCNNCGTELPDGSKFCDVCGSRLDGPVNTQTDSQPVQPQPQPQYQQPQPQYQQQYQASYQQQVYTNGAPAEEKSKKGLIIALVSIVGVLFLIAIGVIVWFFADRMSHASSPKEKVATEETVNNEDQVTPASVQPPETTPIATSTPTPTPEPEEREADEAAQHENVSDINELSDEEASDLAQMMSVTDRPNISDWEFIGSALWGGHDYLAHYFDNERAITIHNPLLCEGDWKFVRTPIPNVDSSDTSSAGNVNIHTVNGKVSMGFDTWAEFDGIFEGDGKVIEGDFIGKYTGKWNDGNASFYVEDDAEMMEIDKIIYLDDSMYAFGTITWISGEQEYLVLIRPISRMELIDPTDLPKISNDEIVERARKKSGAPAAELDSVDADGTLNIHLYEDMGDHTATVDWYTINPDTLKGRNMMGEPVDLNK